MPKDTAKSKQLKQSDREISPNETIEPSSLCWRSELISCYESLWSLLHKFALLNAVKVEPIREILGVQCASNVWLNRNRDDMRYLNGLDQAKLMMILNLQEKQIKESAVTSFIKENEIQSLTCETLRYCRKCFESDGFHSALYQLLFLTKCPIHNEKFVTACDGCGNTISYRLNAVAFKKPGCCSKCSRPLGLITSKVDKKFHSQNNFKLRDQSLKLIAEWLFQRLDGKSLDRLAPRVSKDNRLNVLQTQRELSEGISSKVINYWQDVFSPNTKLKKILNEQGSAKSDLHLKLNINFPKPQSARVDLFNKDWDGDLYHIFKSISRYFIKTQLKNHLNCINEYGQNILWDKYTLNGVGQICPTANAFIIWRMYYEGIDHPIKLFKKFKGFIAKDHISWQPPSCRLPESVLKRIFALECYWLFYECKLLAEWLNTRELYSFNQFYISNNFIPHWIVQIDSEKSVQAKFHWWIETSRLEFLKNVNV